MSKRPCLYVRAIVALAAILALPAISTAQVRVIMSGGFATAYKQVLPEFERTTGIKVTTGTGASQGNGPDTIAAQIGRGEPVDVVIMSREGLDLLIADDRIMEGTDRNLAQTPMGVAVRSGAPRPDISTLELFKQALVSAKAVAYPGSTTGMFMTTTLFPRLGIADEIARKVTITTRGSGAVALVAKGEAELALQPVSELVHQPGVDFVGLFPPEAQYISVFSAAIVVSSTETEASRRLIEFLASDKATAAIRNSGMERPQAR
jgi:molybdate transport system substrate-binding protein